MLNEFFEKDTKPDIRNQGEVQIDGWGADYC